MSTEKKDIREYLHFYIGCEVMTTDGVGWLASVNRDRREMDSLLLNNRVTVHFKTIRLTHNSVDGYDKKRNYGDYLISQERYFPINATDNTEPEFIMPGGVKPLLYRLEDISKEDAKGLWEVVFNRKFHKNGDIRYFDKSDNTDHGKRMVLMAGVERLGIEFEGRIWADSDMILWNYKQHLVTHYLLSKGYWLFGNDWFDEGYIIDKKTLNND